MKKAVKLLVVCFHYVEQLVMVLVEMMNAA